jgi:hypothetical protein
MARSAPRSKSPRKKALFKSHEFYQGGFWRPVEAGGLAVFNDYGMQPVVTGSL